jgi:hypothetical protein
MDSLNSFTVGPKKGNRCQPAEESQRGEKERLPGATFQGQLDERHLTLLLRDPGRYARRTVFKNFAMTVFQNASTVARRPRPRPDMVQ